MKKRIRCVLLALSLALMAPATAFAAEEKDFTLKETRTNLLGENGGDGFFYAVFERK